MTQEQLIALILSAPFAVALTSIIRRLFPKLDGPALVWGTAIALSVLGNVLLAVTQHTSIAWAVGTGLGMGIMGCGLVQTQQSAAAKGGITKEVRVVSSDPVVMEKTELPIPISEILTFPEDGNWVACWPRYDLVSQGTTEQRAIDALQSSAEIANAHGLLCDPTPADEAAVWREKHLAAHRRNGSGPLPAEPPDRDTEPNAGA